jgi:hypothetical protein
MFSSQCKGLKFGDLSPEAKMVRLKAKLVLEVSGCRKIVDFMAKCTNLDEAFLPVLLQLLEQEFLKKDAISVTSREDLEDLAKDLEGAKERIRTLEEKVESFTRQVVASSGKSPRTDMSPRPLKNAGNKTPTRRSSPRYISNTMG